MNRICRQEPETNITEYKLVTRVNLFDELGYQGDKFYYKSVPQRNNGQKESFLCFRNVLALVLFLLRLRLGFRSLTFVHKPMEMSP